MPLVISLIKGTLQKIFLKGEESLYDVSSYRYPLGLALYVFDRF